MIFDSRADNPYEERVKDHNKCCAEEEGVGRPILFLMVKISRGKPAVQATVVVR
jgi:hypothetical protein